MLADGASLLKLAVACGLLGASGVLSADADELPEIEFLEYLGSWEESDEDWLVVKEADRIRGELMKDERSDPAPEDEESPEKDNERE